MPVLHAKPGVSVNLLCPPEGAPSKVTYALTKTKQIEVIRMVLAAGKEVPDHKVNGEFTLQCLVGRVEFKTASSCQIFEVGDWVYLEGGQVHSLKAEADAVLLLTVVLGQEK